MNQKKQRIEDEDLLERVRQQPCLACSKKPSDPHHVTTRGAGGGDVEENVMPLCREHHTMIHAVGITKMCWRFPEVQKWLMKMKRYDIIRKLA